MVDSPSLQEIRQRVEELEKELSFFRVLLQMVQDPIVFLDPKGGLLEINQRGQEILGYREQELRHKAFIDLVNLDDLSRVRDEMDSMKEDLNVPFNLRVVNRSGEIISMEISGCRRNGGYVLFLKDLRETEKREALRERKEKELKDKIRERDLYARELQSMKDLYKQKSKDIEAVKEEALLLSHTDDLTGLFNHRFFIQQLGFELERQKRYPSPLSLLMIDVDFFKKYNDANGHLAGDQVLKATALLIRQAVRQSDIVARYGGEEFVAILINAGKEKAFEIAERVRRNIAAAPIPNGHFQPGGNFTVSIGSATHSPGVSLTELLREADNALYRAKKRGRNRVESL